MKKKTKDDFFQPMCGNCRFYKPQESTENMNDSFGLCFAMPPVPHVTDEGLASLRPMVEVDEAPCAFHQLVAQ
jgi:hypothetical protein